MNYLIRTNSKVKKTYIARVGKPNELLGIVYTDFTLCLGDIVPNKSEIVYAYTKKALASLHLYEGNTMLSIKPTKSFLGAFQTKGKELASFSKDAVYQEQGQTIVYRKLPKPFLLSKEEYNYLAPLGVTHAYMLEKPSTLEQVWCFEKDGDISGLVYAQSNKSDVADALKGLALVLAQRIENQEFIFEFLKTR